MTWQHARGPRCHAYPFKGEAMGKESALNAAWELGCRLSF
jgi:hypothetical protein